MSDERGQRQSDRGDYRRCDVCGNGCDFLFTECSDIVICRDCANYIRALEAERDNFEKAYNDLCSVRDDLEDKVAWLRNRLEAVE